jgi:hypothetical protein
MHVADHTPPFSAEVTDSCSCKCASAVCLHGVTGTTLPFTIVLEE